MWAKMMKDLGATDPKAMMLRFHTQTGAAPYRTAAAEQYCKGNPANLVGSAWAAPKACIPMVTMKPKPAYRRSRAHCLRTQQIVVLKAVLPIRWIRLPAAIL
jgi:hypothetical protein